MRIYAWIIGLVLAIIAFIAYWLYDCKVYEKELYKDYLYERAHRW